MRSPSIDFGKYHQVCMKKGHTKGAQAHRWTECLVCGVHYQDSDQIKMKEETHESQTDS